MNVHVVGVSHIDLGFTMTEEELSELLEILVERMLGVLDRNPKIHYAIEQMYHYKSLAARRPDLIERIRAYIARGRIDVMGAMASSMETNFPSGEAFVRNQLLGLLWAEENLGARPRCAWLVDTFGLNPQLPQVLGQFGFRELFANRFGGDKREEIFDAVGLDGSAIAVIGADLASVNSSGESVAFRLCRSWADLARVFHRADALTGDGPRLVTAYIENEEVLSLRYQALAEARKDRTGESWRLSSHHAFIDDLRASGRRLPRVDADLNPEFTGTFSLRMDLKLAYRQTETLLLEAEKWRALLFPALAESDFDGAWWKLAFVQFHDVFSGSHGDETFHNALDKLLDVRNDSRARMEQAFSAACEADANAFVCINGLAWARECWLRVPDGLAGRQIAQNGRALPMALRDGAWYARASLLPAGCASLRAQEVAACAPAEETLSNTIENESAKLVVCRETGAISLFLADGTPVIEGALDYLTVQEEAGGFQIESPNGGEIFACADPVRVSHVCTDAMGQTISVSGELKRMAWNRGANRLKWAIAFSAVRGEAGVRMRVTLDWRGEGARVRLNLPTTVNAAQAYYEVPFGVAARTAYRPRPTAKGEWPAQRFVAFEDARKGLALINRGAAGVEVCGKALCATLLRAYYPGPMAWVPPTAETSQHGVHTFEFLLAPYAGSWTGAGIARAAQNFNEDALCLEGKRLRGGEESYLSVEPENLVVSCVKIANDGSRDLIVRLYETAGKNTVGRVRVKGAQSAARANVREAALGPLACDGGAVSVRAKPFEIVTLRIARDFHTT